MENEELKTLKDFETFTRPSDKEGIVVVKKEELKQGAIKRVKHWQLRMDQMEIVDGKEDNYNYFKGMRDEAKIANNITDKDLE